MQNEQAYYQQAVQYYQSKDLINAEDALRQALSINPQHAPSLYVMGVIAMDVQKFEIAEELVRSAINYQDNVPAYHFALGRILVRLDKKEDAEKSYKKAIALKPDYVDALNNLATILLSSGRSDEAIKILNSILKKNPDNTNALCNIASALYERGRFEESLEYYNKALSLNAVSDKIYFDIGRILTVLDRTDEALGMLEKGAKLNPDNIEIISGLGDIYRGKGQYDEALFYYKRAKKGDYHEYAVANIVRIYFAQGQYVMALAESEQAVKDLPHSVPSLNNLATTYYKLKEYQKALNTYNLALALNPNDAEVYANMAVTLKDLGQTDASLEAQKKSLELAPNNPHVYSNILLTMIYAQSVTAEDLMDMARQFGENVADPLMRTRAFDNDRTLGRKLRIGYVSPDFRNHAVSYFLAPVFHYNKDQFEIFAYSNVQHEDDVTTSIKKNFDHWRDIQLLKDHEAANLIESDKIDILVDLAGHTAGNSLMVFARKPAPIQITWLGYTATTGMKAMDYRITDPYAEPPGLCEHLNTEELWRLPESFIAYSPRENSPPVVHRPPCEENGYITFGCFNNFTKVTDNVLSTWASILNKVPNSKILIELPGIDDDIFKKQVEDRFIKSGMSLDRVQMELYRKANQFVLYNRVDICLDPFPCVGGTTSMDTLWMGVPFVTLAGRSFSARMGVSILSNISLQELIAKDVDDYITIAANLANDPERLRRMRHGLRDRMAASPLMDQKRFTQNLEDAYQKMWEIWLDKTKT